MTTRYGGIEAGGTKFVCVVAAGPDQIEEEIRFHTEKPDETIGRAIEFFRQYDGQLAAIGIGSFGPVDLQPDSDTYGYITITPKPHWSNVDFAARVQQALDLPVGFDTDVNAAALGEWRWGAAQGLANFVYLTVGTGIGGGGMINGRLMHGLVHPEMGHIRLPHDREADPFPGRCPYHGDCLEGMACGPAMEDRWGQKAQSLPEGHPAWELEATYLAYAMVNFICTLSPERLILGGGVMKQKQLFPLIRRKTAELLNDYVRAPAILEEIDSYIVPPALGDQAGMLGAIALARQAAEG
ncbi:MAG: ROK family protein [Candidatus Promineifilaceae bacterium]|nr:ROK family protein [Candidatus Promineifilaceae bacterium]